MLRVRESRGTREPTRVVLARAVLALGIVLLGAAPASGQRIKQVQFADQPIADILLAMGQVAGVSILPDETVKGTASYRFAEMDFEDALKVFLSTYKLYYQRRNGIFYVSKIQVDLDPGSGLVSMDAEDVDLALLLRAASRALGTTVLFDPMPPQALTVHAAKVEPLKLLQILTARSPDYQVISDKDYFYVRKVPVAAVTAAAAAAAVRIERTGDRYSVQIANGRLNDALDALFQKAGFEYSMMFRKDMVLDRMRWQDKSFEEALRLLLDQASADFTRIGGVYYLFDVPQREIVKKLETSIRLPLNYLSVKDINALIPAGLISTPIMKIDQATNSVILTGSVAQIGPVQDFLRSVDRPLEGRQWVRFQLNYLEAAKIETLLPAALKQVDPVVLPGSNSFVALVLPEIRDLISSYLATIDTPPAGATVRLRYIKAEDLLKKLPPSVRKEEIIETGDPCVIFVRTSPEKLADFYRELAIIDAPVAQIRYHFLVIQHTASDSMHWSDDLEASPTGPDSRNSLLASIGSLLGLDLDIVTTFGLQFALSLNYDISHDRAHVIADTGLVGLSGEEIRFQNTDTFRYQEAQVDTTGKVQYTGVTREITAGLIFKVRGWVSGDGMITMDVNATVSKLGSFANANQGVLPPTSENVISTRARTPSGRPVALGGLTKQDADTATKKTPALGDIPLLGAAFQSRTQFVNDNQFDVYIIPSIEYGDTGVADTSVTLERLYRELVKGAEL